VDTNRVDICYRPLRIAWAILANDIEAFRQAVRLSHTLWGGRFNPIVVVDREEEPERLVDLFRVDIVLPVGDSDAVKEFPKRFAHLIKPFFHDSIFIGGANKRIKAQVLDIQNALVHLRESPKWKAIKKEGFRFYSWHVDDPLNDVFLMQFGIYPSVDEIGIDYRKMLMQAAEAIEHAIDPMQTIPLDVLNYPTISYLTRHGLSRHYSVRPGWDSPGFFVGDAANFDDLVTHWNLRAADIPLWFVDPNHSQRYAAIIPAWEKRMRDMVSRRHEFDRNVAVWSRRENIDEARKSFGDLKLMGCPVSIHSWNGRNICPAMMHFDQVSALGVVGRESGKPKVSFPLNDKPFCGDIWFRSQYLVASVSFIGGLYGDEQHTLVPPFIPELNEFYARTMHFQYNKLRIESERIGLVINAADTDTFLYALPVAELITKIFEMAGFNTELSSAGLITRQLIGQLGGLQGARAFKIPGVRRLIKTYGPTASFTKQSAIQLIASTDPENPDANFNDYQDLYIEPRPIGTKLKPAAIFSHLVEKGLFRIGAKLTCPNCRISSWTALDSLKQQLVCELCGHKYNATSQLVNGEWHYRRSGVLGVEKNAQGAIPVALTLQQLETNIGGKLNDGIYSPSLKLEPFQNVDTPKCEVDFVWIIARSYPRKTAVIFGECKDQGPIKLDEFEKDIANLRCVADALPRKRFKTFVMLVKLYPFTSEEIKFAKTLNDKYRYRAILLTARELEPYHIYDRTKSELDIKSYGGTPEDLAQATVQIYFNENPDG
jgi:hypothetical protein